MRTFMANSDIKSSDRRTVLLGRKVMDEVSKVVPVLPVPLVATAIKSANAPLQDAQIQELCADLLKKLKLDNRKVAIEHNGVIIPKTSYKKKYLKSNDKLEVVHFIGGG